MKIEIQVDPNITETKVIIFTNQVNEETNYILKKFSDESLISILGFNGDIVEILKKDNIYRIYSLNGKVIAETKNNQYTLKYRLYELESKLDNSIFVRISNSEIINLKYAKSFDLSISGTICVTLTNGIKTYVSRRYVNKIKNVLGL